MRPIFRCSGLALSLLAFALVPAAAQAGVAKKVDRHVSAAAGAFKSASASAKTGDAVAFGEYAKLSRKAAAKAERKALAVKERAKRARLLKRVAGLHDTKLIGFAGLIDDVSPNLQLPLVNLVGFEAEARAELVHILTRVADRLPEPARTQVLEALARFSDGGEIDELFEALVSENVVGGVKDLISEHLGTISEMIGGVLDELGGLTGTLPGPAAAVVDDVLAMIEANLDRVFGMIDGILGGLGGGSGDPGGAALPGLGSLCDLLGGFLPISLPVCD
jgi:hypothetical protein